VTAPAFAALAAPRAVSTIDLWKTLALLLIGLDHVGFFLLPEQPWLMALGRAALPVFFFLIGFARSRHVPWFWWAAGAALTALDLWRLGSVDGMQINILINFALIRLALPWIEALVMPVWWRTLGLAAVLAALAAWTGPWIEYGTTGWLLALVGLAHRQALAAGPDRPRDRHWLMRRGLGATATLVFAAIELHDYAFAVTEAWIMAAAVIGVSGLLLRFRTGDASWQPPALLAGLARLCGRRSLEIYIAQIVGLMMIGLALGIEPADAEGDEE
jgi:TraX protein